jgi:hypothetical protein
VEGEVSDFRAPRSCRSAHRRRPSPGHDGSTWPAHPPPAPAHPPLVIARESGRPSTPGQGEMRVPQRILARTTRARRRLGVARPRRPERDTLHLSSPAKAGDPVPPDKASWESRKGYSPGQAGRGGAWVLCARAGRSATPSTCHRPRKRATQYPRTRRVGSPAQDTRPDKPGEEEPRLISADAPRMLEASHADVAEPVDARDLKSLGGNPVRVQLPPSAPRMSAQSA